MKTTYSSKDVWIADKLDCVDKDVLRQKYYYTFTVFTPTFNRETTLSRVYESLKIQTFRDFEWLIVDDGSTDNTRTLVASWQKEVDFSIRYIWQENQGKHIALNLGVQEAKGELFLTLDSDDSCVPTALERLKAHWDAISDDQRDQFSAVTCLCADTFGNIIGDTFPQDILDATFVEIRYKFKVRGEKWGFHRTDVLKQYPFPVVNNERFMVLNWVWSAIDTRYKTRFINEPLRIYWLNKASRSDHLSRSHPTKFPAAHAFWHQSVLNNEIKWFRYAPEEFFRSSIHYSRFSFLASKNIGPQWNSLKNIFAKMLWVSMLPIGFLLYLRDKRT